VGEKLETKITSKGQMVIPKPIRDKYGLKEGSRVKIIPVKDGVIIKPRSRGPWNGIRGMMAEEWRDADLDQLILEARKSLFKVPS
jgi:AbrB family looped-hinge helix DNA binding protein